jgi:hypothetical protein
MNNRRLTRLVLAGLMAVVAALAGLATGSPASAKPAAAGGSTAAFPFAVTIRNFSSNKCLQPATINPNAVIVQRSCDSRNFLQRWTTSDLGDGYHFLVNQGSTLCLDLQANSEDEVGNGTLTQQFLCSAQYNSEHWNFVPGSRVNHYQVFTLDKGLCLDVRDRSSADGAVIQVWDCKFLETAQEFRFVSA